MGKWEEPKPGQGARRKKRSTEREDGDAVRIVRLQQLIREEVNLLLRSEIRDPRLAGVEITLVELTHDGSSARLWFTDASNDTNDDRRDACERVAGFLRTRLAESLGLKRTPALRFRRDPATHAYALPADPEGDE